MTALPGPSASEHPTTNPPLRPVPAPDPVVASPVVPSSSRLRPLGLAEVAISGGFWARRQETNSVATLAHIEQWLEREGWLGNFDKAANGEPMTSRHGREFSDSEVYKFLEAAAWELGREPDAELEARFQAVVKRVAAAQEADGYIGTKFGRPGQAPRYSDLEWGHELYCQGHLMQAAVARARTGHPDDLLVEVAERSAEHICTVFGSRGNQGVCGHPEIEMGLAELGRALGRRRFIEQAALFVERRGRQTLADIEFGRAYYQDDMPVREAEVFRGHAVRANYLAAGAVDVAVETGDPELVDAVARQWERTVARRTYITGGQGSRHQDEAFGDDFMLPPDRAYSETCASIASVMVSWRLLLETGEARYADLIERTLFNVVATSPAHDGRSFYYANTLHQRIPSEPAEPDVASARAESSLRAPWFRVSCCPPNVARTLASLSAYCATTDERGIQLHQYAPMTIATELPDGAALTLIVDTDYPRSGRVVVRTVEAPDRPWTLSLRVPDWCRDATVTGADGATRTSPPGTVVLDGPAAGEEIVLELDVVPRFVFPDERIDAVRGCVAVQRGPEVWALESVDLPPGLESEDLSRVRVDPAVAPWHEADRVVVRAVLADDREERAWPYAPPETSPAARGHDPIEVPLIPYHDWANRGPSTMRVWIPTV